MPCPWRGGYAAYSPTIRTVFPAAASCAARPAVPRPARATRRAIAVVSAATGISRIRPALGSRVNGITAARQEYVSMKAAARGLTPPGANASTSARRLRRATSPRWVVRPTAGIHTITHIGITQSAAIGRRQAPSSIPPRWPVGRLESACAAVQASAGTSRMVGRSAAGRTPPGLVASIGADMNDSPGTPLRLLRPNREATVGRGSDIDRRPPNPRASRTRSTWCEQRASRAP